MERRKELPERWKERWKIGVRKREVNVYTDWGRVNRWILVKIMNKGKASFDVIYSLM